MISNLGNFVCLFVVRMLVWKLYVAPLYISYIYKENLDAVHISSDFLHEFLPLRILHVELRPNIPNLQIGTLCV